MWNPFDFSGKKIVVAGATSGMGKATAIKLSQQGAQVQLIGRSQEKLDEVIHLLSGNGHRSFAKDLGQTDGYKDILDDIVSDKKKIDGFVYCAGIAKILPISMLSKKTMDESMTVNLYSFVELVGLLSKKKYHADCASIVGVSSISTQYPQKCQGIYVATKAAMNGMVTSMAMELAEKGIRINTVLPSSTKTKMLDEALDGKTDEEKRHFEEKQILGFLEPEDVANVIMFLLSDAAKMITGRSIYADAGFINF